MQRLSRRGYAPFAVSGQHMPYQGFAPSPGNAHRQGPATDWRAQGSQDGAERALFSQVGLSAQCRLSRPGERAGDHAPLGLGAGGGELGRASTRRAASQPASAPSTTAGDHGIAKMWNRREISASGAVNQPTPPPAAQ